MFNLQTKNANSYFNVLHWKYIGLNVIFFTLFSYFKMLTLIVRIRWHYCYILYHLSLAIVSSRPEYLAFTSGPPFLVPPSPPPTNEHTIHVLNTRHSPYVGTMLGQRCRRWANIVTTLGGCFVFPGMYHLVISLVYIQHNKVKWLTSYPAKLSKLLFKFQPTGRYKMCSPLLRDVVSTIS